MVMHKVFMRVCFSLIKGDLELDAGDRNNGDVICEVFLLSFYYDFFHFRSRVGSSIYLVLHSLALLCSTSPISSLGFAASSSSTYPWLLSVLLSLVGEVCSPKAVFGDWAIRLLIRACCSALV